MGGGAHKIIFISLLFVVAFVMAAPLAPTNLIFEQNTTSQYDKEGIFTVNWTAGGGDEVNYSIYVSIDGGTSWYLKGDNNSVSGYSFSNATDANYTFRLEAVNATLDAVNSTSDISMVVDTTNPLINSVYPTNISYATSPTSFNYTYTEINCENVWYSNDSGVTNYSVQSCGVNFSSMVVVENSNTWIVYMNDSAGNENSSSISFVLDTINPVASAACSPSSVNTGGAITCTCGGTDSGSGINSSLTTADSTPSTSSMGTFTYDCSVTDNVGNTHSDTAEYSVTSPSSSGSGGSPVYRPSVSKLSEGYEITLGKNYKVNFEILGEEHVFTVDDILEGSVRISISSDSVTFEIAEGETEKVDLDSDGKYDLMVLLKDVRATRADFVLTLIDEIVDESVSEEVVDEEVVDEEVSSVGDVVDELKEKGGEWFWIVFILIIIVVVAWKRGLLKRFGL